MKTKVKLETEKQVSISDLKNIDHVGYIDVHGSKWQVIITLAGGLNAICNEHKVFTDKYQLARSTNPDTMKSLFEYCGAKEIYKFTTRKELYQWLAE